MTHEELAAQGTDLSADSEGIRDLYRERAHLIAALVRLAALDSDRPAVIAYNDPNEPALPVLYVHTKAGQISWHLNPDDLSLYAAVSVVEPDDPRAIWDGHDKDTALARLRALAEGQSQRGGLLRRNRHQNQRF